jgi:hypothetical protein
MGGLDDAVGYTALALGLVVMIFLGALLFVQMARKGNRRFKWRRSQQPNERSAER